MMNRKKLCALFLCIGFVLVLFVSSAFILHEAGHDCTGEDCPVCQLIAVNLSLLRLSGLAVLLLLVIAALLKLFHSHAEATQICFPFSETLVSWKVRLND